MALVAASTSLSFSTERITCRFTNSFFKSHFITKLNKSNLDPTLQQWRTRSRISFIMQNYNVKRASFQLPLLLLPLRVGRSSSLLFLHKFISSPMSSLNSDANPDVKTVRAVIKGRVQGVFYRDWTVENAKELGLKGWVRNRRDGSVEALFSGSPEKVQEMEQRCRRGPPSAIVTGLDVVPCDDDPGTGFERKQTA
ncbi:uncharacterized protein LOC125870192 [Solanum stenotomum]|uniref:uncharacterized protein LOC125870192 n=1 Tax=Solanum stenotomum TaxID=172797 RepID=UPI0020D177E7|nr:uncharacterized protein LOC125870192 [Solanum stenotomum]XP_049406508.1 uncharacterized protein LOC125870192 [Solanum stenotomum]XP_049406509.1 uncharacterized protein LOC125870192 [Solanum stenotomum]XP_049406510.1 uncharacterized protein LOC125870192 [Solanum stenotomum]